MRPVEFHILVALGDGPKHGYAVMQDISDRTGSRVQLLPGTLYSTLKRLLAEGLIEETQPPKREASTDERRRYYRLTAKGRAHTMEETDRMAMLVRLARRKGFTAAR